MYVAAPIISDGRIIGILTVGKPNAAMAPVIKRSERRILWASAVLLGIALAIGAGMVWWINRSIARLTRYADSVTENRPLALPALGSSELRKLAQALESMRIKLEGKNEIEQYVYALTHELKSPLAAIRGAAEILREGPPADVVTRFTEEYTGAKYANAGAGRNPAAPGAAGKPTGYPSRRLLLMSYLRSLARRAVFSWRQKISPLLYGLPRWLSSPTRSFWRRRWAMCWTMPSTLRLKMALSH